ncbi:MAG: Ig-like domain-containing protein [Candidatus Heteroscillospira sp.]|jgi:hypothetical protein
MGFIPTITCRKCRRQYSGLLKKCPYCGARRQAVSSRPAANSDSVQKGTAAAGRAASNNVWQLAFGLILLAVVMLSVIVLITTSLSGREESTGPNSSPNLISPPPISAALPDASASPSTAPTPSPSPSAQPTSLAVFYNTNPIDNGFTHIVDGEPLQLTATVYPIDLAVTVEWRSTDETVFTVDDTGKVTGVAPGNAKLIVSCGELQKEYPVIIKQSW